MAERNVYPFQFMKKGESILLEGAAHGGKESAAARNYFSRRKMEYRLKKVDGGIMVTLLSEGQPSTERGKRRVRRQQLFSGNKPQADHWYHVSLVTCDGIDWEVWAQQTIVRGVISGWFNLKICASGDAPNKANYWIGWNGERFASGRGLSQLRMGRPHMEQRLVDALSKIDLTAALPSSKMIA
ncbi:MAG: hypothetical protein LW834_21040 [Cyanobium sp. 49614_E6]|nr:hypothetical protein [Cyanobium sp. 49614_E6]